MRNYQPETYGERIAADYDEVFAELVPPQCQIDLLCRLARGGTAVELGVGTGRVAIPLARRNVAVIGVDSSPQMLERLEAKANGLPVFPVLADATDFSIDGHHEVTVAYAVFSTFFMLPGRERQEACLRLMRSLLAQDGVLVLEVFMPHPQLVGDDGRMRVKSVTADQVVVEVSRHDPAAQRVDLQNVRLRQGEPVSLFPTQVHYLWPEQLDQLAAKCGFQLTERYSDWAGSSFAPTADKHISIYRTERP